MEKERTEGRAKQSKNERIEQFLKEHYAFRCNYSAIIGRYRICQFIKPQIRLESHDKKFCCASCLFQRPNEVRGKRPPRSLN